MINNLVIGGKYSGDYTVYPKLSFVIFNGDNTVYFARNIMETTVCIHKVIFP